MTAVGLLLFLPFMLQKQWAAESTYENFASADPATRVPAQEPRLSRDTKNGTVEILVTYFESETSGCMIIARTNTSSKQTKIPKKVGVSANLIVACEAKM